jgi:aryl-alcohol dehydrogenase-like predicted oxidoreductase
MQYRKFGKLDWNVSSMGMGTWALGSNWGPQDDGESVRALHAALDQGCNFIDTARAYGDGRSERVIARALKERSGGDRVYVATKVPPIITGDWLATPYERWEDKFPEQHIRTEIDKSLRALEVDCIDLLQLHTWSRAWNRDPVPFEVLRDCQKQGKVRAIGVSTPEIDQNSVVDLIHNGWVDSVQVIYNIFDQEAQAEIFPTAIEHDVAIIVRVAFDESALTGKLTPATRFPEGDIRDHYFAGDRLERTVRRIENIKHTVGDRESNMAAAALKFALKPPAVTTVIAGMRNAMQARANCLVGTEPAMSDDLERDLRSHNWRRSFWYAGK